jgi:hypothetical protein
MLKVKWKAAELISHRWPHEDDKSERKKLHKQPTENKEPAWPIAHNASADIRHLLTIDAKIQQFYLT